MLTTCPSPSTRISVNLGEVIAVTLGETERVATPAPAPAGARLMTLSISFCKEGCPESSDVRTEEMNEERERTNGNGPLRNTPHIEERRETPDADHSVQRESLPSLAR